MTSTLRKWRNHESYFLQLFAFSPQDPLKEIVSDGACVGESIVGEQITTHFLRRQRCRAAVLRSFCLGRERNGEALRERCFRASLLRGRNFLNHPEKTQSDRAGSDPELQLGRKIKSLGMQK